MKTKVEADIPGAFVFQVLWSQALLVSQCPNILPNWNVHGIGIYLANGNSGNVHHSGLVVECWADRWCAPNWCRVVEKVTVQESRQCKVWCWGQWGQGWSSWWRCSNRMGLGMVRVRERQFGGRGRGDYCGMIARADYSVKKYISTVITIEPPNVPRPCQSKTIIHQCRKQIMWVNRKDAKTE